MSDFSDSNPSLEERLADYGTVLQGHLDGQPAKDDNRGTLLVGAFGAAESTKAKPRKAIAAAVSMAAAVLLFAGLVVPSILGDDAVEPITVTGGDLATQPNGDDSKPDIADDEVLGDNDEAEVLSDGDDKTVDDEKASQDTAAAEEEANDATKTDDGQWSSFQVRVGDGASDDDTPDDAAPDGEVADTKASDDEDKASGDKGEKGDSGETGDGESGECPAGAEKRAVGCVIVGPPPVGGNEGCPDGAVVFANQCYTVVPPSCGDLEPAPGGDGCLKLVGSVDATTSCPAGYELDGSTCVKYVSAKVSCTQGTPVGDACLIQQDPVGGDSGCATGLTQLGDGCYELSAPSTDCGTLAVLADGNCRQPVDGETATSCPAGLQPWESICYRYEDPPTYDCAGGVSDGAGWCSITEAATPGPDVCDDGVLQDAQGCYVLWEIHSDGTCGGLPMFEGKCREAKTAYPTWTCSDGKTVYESTCDVWVEAVSVTCAAGELVENNTKCKTIADPIETTGCPSGASEDAQGCYKVKPPTVGCGDLAITPDGKNCKTWVSSAGADATCESGFDLVGTTCKKYVDGSASCADGRLVQLGANTKCELTSAANQGGSDCSADTVERSGSCYKVVPATCDGLALDAFGTGCKKPAGTAKGPQCVAGYTVVGDECLKKV